MEIQNISFSVLYAEDSVEILIQELFSASRAHIKKYKFNKNFLKKSLRKHDEVQLPIDLVNNRKIYPIYFGREVRLIEENSNFIILSKPAKIHSHPQKYTDGNNLLSSFYQLGLSQFLEVNSEKYDRGLLYRLDFETSGLMVYAKSQKIYEEIRTNFKDFVLRKNYLALVAKGISPGHYSHFLKDSGIKGSKVIEGTKENGKLANLELEILKENKSFSLIKVKLNQGHRHQIRAQLSLMNYPIVGDEIYGGDHSNRLMLHCYEYCIKFNDKSYIFKDENFEQLENCFLDSNE